MNLSTKTVCRNFHHFICLLATILLIGYCAHEYALDRDVTHINFQKFHEEPVRVYPSITICFTKPFVGDKLKLYDKELTFQSFKDFLLGNTGSTWNSELANIDYDNVSVQLEDHLNSIGINLLNNDDIVWKVECGKCGKLVQTWDQSEYKDVQPPNIYVSSRRAESKCYTIDIPYIPHRRIYFVQMELEDSIFPHGIRPNKKDFFVALHYPFQLTRSYLLSRISWESNIRKTDCYTLRIRVGSMEVLKRRNKYSEPCNDDLTDHDKIALTKVMQNVGCQPKHWKIQSQLPYCTTQKQYTDIEIMMDDVEETLPPCQSIERLITTGNGIECNKRGKKLWLQFYFQEPSHKEIHVLRAYGFQSLVGNGGKFDHIEVT